MGADLYVHWCSQVYVQVCYFYPIQTKTKMAQEFFVKDPTSTSDQLFSTCRIRTDGQTDETTWMLQYNDNEVSLTVRSLPVSLKVAPWLPVSGRLHGPHITSEHFLPLPGKELRFIGCHFRNPLTTASNTDCALPAILWVCVCVSTLMLASVHFRYTYMSM